MLIPIYERTNVFYKVMVIKTSGCLNGSETISAKLTTFRQRQTAAAQQLINHFTNNLMKLLLALPKLEQYYKFK